MSAKKPALAGASFSGKSIESRHPEADSTRSEVQDGTSRPCEDGEPLAVSIDTINEGAGEVPLPFPLECLPAVMREIVAETANQTRTPPAMAAVVALGTVAAAIGRSLRVKSGGSRTTSANLFLMVIARSGVGKGQTFTFVSKSLYVAEKNAIDKWNKADMPYLEASLEVSKARSKKAKERAASEKDEEQRKQLILEIAALEEEQRRLEREKASSPCYVVGDITREALAMRLAAQPDEALACFSPEARGILGVIRGRYGNGECSDEDIYLSAYSGEPINVHRMSRPPVSLRSPCLTAVWMTQPDAARNLLGDERMTASGLLPRFLICDAKAEQQYEPEDWPEIKTTVMEAWSNLIDGLLEYRGSRAEPALIEADEEARTLMREFHNKVVDRVRPGGDLRDIESYVARWAENAWRLAAVLHGARHGGDSYRRSLDEGTAQDAIRLMDWFSREQLSILAAGRSDQFRGRLGKLLGVLRAAGGSRTLGQLKDANGFEADEVNSLALQFPDHLIVERLKQPGRPSFVARLV